MDITSKTLDWVRKSFKQLIDNPTNKHFFVEKRYADNCMWVRKIKNKNWIPRRPRSSLRKSFEAHQISSSESETPKKSYAEVLSDNSEDGNKKKSKCSSDESSSKKLPAFEKQRAGLNRKLASLLYSNNSETGQQWANTTSNLKNGNACGGFIDVAKETLNKENLIEAKVKVKYNYTGFVPASILIKDDIGHEYIIQTVPPPESRWLIERNVKIHGTFKSEVARDFDEFNFSSETFTFAGFHAIPPDNLREKVNVNITKIDDYFIEKTPLICKQSGMDSHHTIKDQKDTHYEGEPSDPLKNENVVQDENLFKQKLVEWLKENELKLSHKYPTNMDNSSYVVIDSVPATSGEEPKGDTDLT
ncbi:hypothetical protein E5676_scaffold83G001410 [Cucumis melo var. makuwa]|uniref:Uncharacterized protein n=1 Tax=Cucumis melo var. makuwa TaxID=1194695 RepID=A0A5D3C2M8_CUCMM|nr:hypothetical protein E5676_scaffold83G001410 [Cucumis melo var. makuwa]